MTDVAVRFAHLGIRFGDDVVIDDLDLDIHRGEFLCLLGPSGCGKSTMLRVIGDLVDAEGTTTVLGDEPSRMYRSLAYVFQAPRLVSWRTAIDNVVLGMQLRGMEGRKRRLRRRAEPYLSQVGLGDLTHRAAHVLSGGEQQRVAIARALAVEPEILLMDEPFSALDIRTRNQLRHEIVTIWKETGLTIVFVTHDVDEAVILGSRVVVLSNKPTCVAADILNDLPYPRDRASEAFEQRREELVRALGGTTELD